MLKEIGAYQQFYVDLVLWEWRLTPSHTDTSYRRGNISTTATPTLLHSPTLLTQSESPVMLGQRFLCVFMLGSEEQ